MSGEHQYPDAGEDKSRVLTQVDRRNTPSSPPETVITVHAVDSEPQQPQINIGLLKIEFGEIADKMTNIDRVISYNKEELKYLIKVAMNRAKMSFKSLQI